MCSVLGNNVLVVEQGTPTPPFISRGQSYNEGTESVKIFISIGTLSLTCLIYKIYISGSLDTVMMYW
jgi:hypothetical protein